jgi:hypothetical protein
MRTLALTFALDVALRMASAAEKGNRSNEKMAKELPKGYTVINLSKIVLTFEK